MQLEAGARRKRADSTINMWRYSMVFAAIFVVHCMVPIQSTSSAVYRLPSTRRNLALSRISRGGGEEAPQDSKSHQDDSKEHDNVEQDTSRAKASELVETTIASCFEPKRKVRHTSDIIANLMEQNMAEESLELRELISKRAQSYMDELLQTLPGDRIPNPKRVLHYVAPKIPAIKQSPDLMLRIQSSRGGIDAGVAACAIGTVARLCELYDRQNMQKSDADDDRVISVGVEVIRDRRFQQLVECILCGVDLRKRKGEAERMKDADENEESRDIEEVLDQEDVKIDDGLSVQDACRAAWGIAILGGFHAESFSGVPIKDILTALSLRSRELLLARLQLLRQGDTQKQGDDDEAMTLLERLNKDAEALAEDAASAMWTFACVKACTGTRSVPLFEACCSILCQNPTELRERAQAGKEGLDGSSFELNDVVERLARSEVDASTNEVIEELVGTTSQKGESTNKTDISESTSASEDALLDWLTPNEATDVLWALALHGSTTETDSKEEIALSETAAAFREIAFDRLVGWLHEDSEVIEAVRLHGASNHSAAPHAFESLEAWSSDGSGVSSESTSNSHGSMVVEVVDAAALLSSSATMDTEFVSTLDDGTTKDDHRKVGVTQVQVVDAATLLAQTPEDGPLGGDTEVVVTSTVSPSHGGSAVHEPELKESAGKESSGDEKPEPEIQKTRPSASTHPEDHNVFSDMANLLRSRQLSFSPHDLCSIAWAVTDLRDPLRFLIVDLITQMFASLGKDSMVELPVGDLSNLAWAISRSASQKKDLSWSDYSDTPQALVMRWTAEHALEKLKVDGDEPGDYDIVMAVRSMLQEFQPPELGRLMWSFASTVANHVDPFEHGRELDVAMGRLAKLALLGAVSNRSIFGTEDLARITWAFLELCDLEEALSQPLVAESLGCAISVIESSLLLWESGGISKTATRDAGQAEDSLFSTFFGKSRFPLPLLNQRISEHEDEDDETSKPARPGQKTPLPLLRDLTVDPSTLCKLALAVSDLNRKQPTIKGCWTFVRVAVRLLSSKNGQLMDQCPIRDVIRLCIACALTRINSREREHVVRLFARRVVQFLNEAFDPDRESYGKAAARIARASPWETSSLIWSLGEMGARHSAEEEHRQMAYRKLNLITSRPLLSDDQLQSLSAESTANLLNGIVALKMVPSDPSFVCMVLRASEGKVKSLQSGKELIDLAETLVKVKRDASLLERPQGEGTKGGAENNSTKSETSAANTMVISSENGQQGHNDTDVISKQQNGTSVVDALLESTDQVLGSLAQKATEKAKELSAVEMRRLLLCLVLAPFQAETLVEALEREMNRRAEALDFAGGTSKIQDIARQAANSAMISSNSISRQSEGTSPVQAIKNGIKAVFGVQDDNDVSKELSDEDAEKVAEFAHTIHHTAALTRESAARLERMSATTEMDAEKLLRGAEQGAAVELGRCRELIARYRTIDFPTGSQGRRHMGEHRQDTEKRILSRLFP